MVMIIELLNLIAQQSRSFAFIKDLQAMKILQHK